MNKKSYTIPMLLLILLLSLTLLPLSAFALTPASATLPVSVRVNGSAPMENYRFRLTPRDKAPMPAEGQEYCEISCTGARYVSFPTVIYPTVGIYHYTVSQIPGSYPGAQYDDRVYDVTVTVSNSEDRSGLSAAISVRNDGKKYEAAEFTNAYTPEVTYQPVYVRKLWVDPGQNRPASVTVKLISEGRVLATAVLNAENGWSYAWKGLVESGKEWHIVEDPVPGRYVVSYSHTGNVATITNTLTTGLIQTGQLVWPIWVLGGAGILLGAVGIAGLWKRRKKNHE